MNHVKCGIVLSNIMNSAVLACGGLYISPVAAYVFLGGVGVLVASVIWGLTCLFRGAPRLGLGLISIPICIVAALLMWLGIL